MIANLTTTNTMNYISFDRHQLFTEQMVDFHSHTLRMVEDYHIDKDESWHTPLYNMLCGIWDGYLYEGMVDMAKQMGLDNSLIKRIETTIHFINGLKN
jgi:hypothetical protein